MGLGLTTTLPATLSNAGAALLDFELKEKPGEVIPLHAPSAGEDVLVVQYDITAATAMETALTALGFTYLGVSDIQFQAMPVSELLTYQAVFYAGTTGFSGSHASEILLLAYLDAGGSLYISDNDLGYWRHGYPFYDTYLQAIFGIDNGGDLLTGDDIMTGLNPDITADPYPDNFTIGPEGVQIFHFTASGIPAGVSVDRNGYRAIYTSFDFQYIVSAADQIDLVNRIMEFLGTQDVTWLSEQPASGSVPMASAQDIEVTFDASVPEVFMPGTYTADLIVKSNDPLNNRLTVPVQMVVTAPADWGELRGTVETQGYCDSNPAPLGGATVMIESGDGYSFSTQTDANGFYHIWADSDHNPLTVTVTAVDQSDGSAVVNIIPGGVVEQNFSLRWLKPCVSASPDTLEATVALGYSTTITLTLQNTGAVASDFVITEQDGGYHPNQVAISIPASDGKFEHTPAVLGRAPKVNGSEARMARQPRRSRT